MARTTEARQMDSEAEEMAFGPESEKTQEQAMDLVVEKTDIGHDIGNVREIKALDGSKREEVFVGASERTQTYARIGADGETRLHAIDSKEATAKLEAAKTFNELAGSVDAMAKAILSSMPGLSAEARAASLKGIESNPLALVSEALKSQKNPNEAMMALLRSKLEQHPEVKQAATEKSLAELQTQQRELMQKARQAGSEKEYNDVQADIYALEQQMLQTEARLNPNASKAEKQVAMDRMEGFVVVTPEPIYEKGIDAVKARQKELGKLMDTAKDQLTWEAAKNEMDRHSAMMPVLERVDQIQMAEAEAQKLIEEATAKQLLEKQEALKSVKGKKGYWKSQADQIALTMSHLEFGLRLLEKAGNTKNVDTAYAKMDKARKEVETKLKQIQSRIKQLDREGKQLEKAGVNIDLGADHKIAGAKFDLYAKLATMHRENPGMVEAYVSTADKNKDLSKGTREIIAEFKTDLAEGRLSPIEPKAEPAEEEEGGLLDSRFSAGDEDETGFAQPAALEKTKAEIKRADVPAADLDDQFWAERKAGKEKAAAEGRQWTKEDADKLAVQAQIRTTAKRAEEPRVVRESELEESPDDSVTQLPDVVGGRTDAPEASQRAVEMPVITPAMLAKKKRESDGMPGFGDWVAGDAQPSEQPQKATTVEERAQEIMNQKIESGKPFSYKDAETQAKQELGLEPQTVFESIRVNKDKFPTQKMDSVKTEEPLDMNNVEAVQDRIDFLKTTNPKKAVKLMENYATSNQDTLGSAQVAQDLWGVNFDDYATVEEAVQTMIGRGAVGQTEASLLSNLYRAHVESKQGQAPTKETESGWWNKAGVEKLSGAWQAWDKSAGPGATEASLLTMGVPKGILRKYNTPQALYQFTENPGFWASLNGDAAATREALNRFVEEAYNTRVISSPTESLAKKSLQKEVSSPKIEVPR